MTPDTILDRSLAREGRLRTQPPPAFELPASLLATVGVIGRLACCGRPPGRIGQAVFPSTKGYAHFRFSDYSKLTIIGVIIACVAWPIVTRISSAPRWLFFRLAIVVTLVLFLPDLYILKQGQPAKAVAVLMCMHLAIALVTYNALVHKFSCQARSARRPPAAPPSEVNPTLPQAERSTTPNMSRAIQACTV